MMWLKWPPVWSMASSFTATRRPTKLGVEARFGDAAMGYHDDYYGVLPESLPCIQVIVRLSGCSMPV